VATHRILLCLHSPLLAGLLGEAGEGAGLSLPLSLPALRGLVTLMRGEPGGEEVRRAAAWLGFPGEQGVKAEIASEEEDSGEENKKVSMVEMDLDDIDLNMKQSKVTPKKEQADESSSNDLWLDHSYQEESDDEEINVENNSHTYFASHGKIKSGVGDKNKLFPCDHCDNKFTTQYYLTKHMFIKHKIPIICHDCNKTLMLTDFKEHMRTNHTQCEICGVHKTNKKALNEHIEAVHQEDSTCPHCGLQFSTKTLLRKHVERMHSDKEILTCSKCDYKTHMPSTMKVHWKNWHSEAVQQTCEHCGDLFKRLDLHLKRTGCGKEAAERVSDKIPCPQCEKKFSRDTLPRHIKRIHEGQKGRHCPHCSYSTYSGYNLKLHVSKVHLSSELVKVSCPYCEKETTNLDYHIKVYHGEKDS
jgi:hypothetical protein